MPIITSFVTANGGSVPPPASTTNLALILGICIPVGIISKYIYYHSYWSISILHLHQKIQQGIISSRLQIKQHHSKRNIRTYSQRITNIVIQFILISNITNLSIIKYIFMYVYINIYQFLI